MAMNFRSRSHPHKKKKKLFLNPHVRQDSHQHCRPEIKFVEELSDENVHFQHVSDVVLLDISQHVNEPLELAVGRADPQEVDLTAEKAMLM